ncbi:MAG: hypothetical protein S4CHLAM6_07320 [Chlamydiae bacterium]|nr:hypothetical protein [Chlamydiota bacterium]
MLIIQNLKRYLPFFAKLALGFILTAPLCASEMFDSEKEKQFREKISYNLLIRNDTEATRQALQAVQSFPESIHLRRLYIESLSSIGSEKKLLRAWQNFSRDFPKQKYEDQVLELVAKGVLHNAELSEPYMSKYYRYAVADKFTDSSSVEVLKEAFHDSNFAVREMALNAALLHGDEVLCDEILELLNREHLPTIRRKALEVLIRIKGDDAKPLAESMLADPKLSYLDRLSLILTLLDGKKSMNREELEKLATSSQAIERLIACYTFGYFGANENLDLLKNLINDPIQDVRLQAITSLGHLRVTQIDGQSVNDLMKPIIKSESCELSLLASWVSMLNNDLEQAHNFRDFFYHSNQKIRLQAASLVGYSLPNTLELAEEFFQTHTDPYVRLNLSVLLITHRKRVEEASNQIFEFLKSSESSQFKASMPYPMETIWPVNLVDSFERQMSGISSVTQSEVVQFCLLNLLAIVEDPRANVAISNFLETHHSNAALASMPQFIRAGSAPLLELICSFFNHPDLTKRIQAAALVAMLKKEEKALEVLYEAYPLVDRALKEMIITIVGQIGSKDSIPFLMDAIYEPSQSMRILASSSLMQCLRS